MCALRIYYYAPLIRRNTPKRIALLLGQDLGYSRRVLSGVLNYSEGAKLPWVYHNAPPDVRVLPALERWRPHGILVHLSDRTLAERLLALNIPIISVTDTLPRLSMPKVDVDSELVGAVAADYFLGLGFRSFAYYGSRTVNFSRKREIGFRRRLESFGHRVANLHADFLPHPPFTQDWSRGDRQTERWLEQLPKPIGILASNDIPGRALCEHCRNAGIEVPQEVAILGVDNDVSECRMSSPTLSSVDIPAEKIGRCATERLAHMIAGKSSDFAVERLPPICVIARSSTDRLATDNDVLRRALVYIERHADQGIRVDTVCEHLGQSRRTLERHFEAHFNCTVFQQIQRVRVARVKRLLVETDLSISEVAERAGFSGLRQLDRVFRQLEGKAPTRFRSRC